MANTFCGGCEKIVEQCSCIAVSGGKNNFENEKNKQSWEYRQKEYMRNLKNRFPFVRSIFNN